MTIDWSDLSRLSPTELTNALHAELDKVVGDLFDEDEDRELARMPDPLRVLWLLSWLDCEVAQGSLLAYFLNSHGRHAGLAVEALREIGANLTADVLARATESVRATEDEWAARRAALAKLDEYTVVHPYIGLSNADELADLTDQYWLAADHDDWGKRLESFLVASVQAYASSDSQ